MIDAPKQNRAVVPLRQSSPSFEDRVRELAKDSRNIKWSQHARDRMNERGIPNRVALTVRRRGFVEGEITPGKNEGEWRAKMIRQVRGKREVGVVVVKIRNSRLFVKTVEWEDLK